MSKRCRDEFEAPGCLGKADDRYTMDFSDVRPGTKIHWCRVCGPRAHRMQAAIEDAFKTRPGFEGELRKAIEKAEREKTRN